MRKILAHLHPHLFPAILLTFVTLVVYANSLNNAFVWDDNILILANDAIKDWRNLPSLFTSDYFRQFKIQASYRPVTTLSYFVDYSLWGLNPFGYHLTNLSLHIFNTLLLYLFIFFLTRRPNLSLLAGALFALHPIHTESVNAITFRDDLIAFPFFLLALFCYLRSSSDPPLKRSFRLSLYGASLILYGLSLLSKEMALSLPLVLLLTDLCFSRPGGSHPLAGIRQRIGLYGGFWLISAIYLGLRFYLLRHPQEDLWSQASGGLWTPWINTFPLWVAYLRLLLLPTDLSAYHVFPLSPSLGDPWVLASMGIIAGLLAVSFLSLKSRPELSWGILWIFLTLLPVTNLVPTESAYLAERFAYLPSVGFCLLAAALLAQGARLRPRPCRGLALLLLGLIPLFYAQGTLRRNFVWQDDLPLWQDTVRKSPSRKAYMNLGHSHLRRKEWGAAIEGFQQALQIDPRFAPAWSQLGMAYIKQGNLAQGVEAFERALELDPSNPEAASRLEMIYAHVSGGDPIRRHLWRGDLYEREGNDDRAIGEFREALQARPDHPETLNRLGVALARREELEAAIQQFQRVLEIDPPNAHALNNLGLAYQGQGRLEEAVRCYQKALRHDPTYAPAHLNLGIVYLERDRTQALHHLRESLKHAPRLPQKKAVEEAIRRLSSAEEKR